MARRSAQARGSVTRRSVEEIGTRSGRERLLKAALRLFASQGYAGTSVRDIMGAAGVTVPALYHHFGNKEGLFLAIIRMGQLRFEAAEQEVLASAGSAAVRILRLGRVYVALRREFADLAWVVRQIVSGPRRRASRIDFRVHAFDRIRILEQLVEEGMASGEFRPCAPSHVALALIGAIEIVSRPYLFDRDGGGSNGALEGVLAVILSGIAASRVKTAPRGGATAGPAARL